MSRFVEERFPWFAAALLGAATCWCFWSRALPTSMTDLLAALISVASIAVGFLATAKSILVSIDDRPIIRQIRNVNRYTDLIDYMMCSIHWSFCLGSLCVSMLLVDLSASDPITRTLMGCLGATTGGAAASYYRVVSLFQMILKQDASRGGGM